MGFEPRWSLGVYPRRIRRPRRTRAETARDVRCALAWLRACPLASWSEAEDTAGVPRGTLRNASGCHPEVRAELHALASWQRRWRSLSTRRWRNGNG